MLENFRKIVALVLLVVLESRGILTQKISDCSDKETTSSVINDPIDLTFKGEIIIYKNVTINEILSTSNNQVDKLYINAKLKPTDSSKSSKNNLIIYTTEHFVNYSKEQTLNNITLQIQIACPKGRNKTLVFIQPFLEKNYFAPEFSKQIYEIILPTPVFAGFDLTSLTEILAKDYDLVHNELRFSSPNASEAHIKVGVKNYTHSDTKTFKPYLKLEKILTEFNKEISFEIVAIDSATVPKVSTAQVIIRPDPRTVISVKPRFENSSYIGHLTKNFTLVPLEVKIVPETYSANVSLSISGRDARFFSISNKENVIEVHLEEKLNKTFARTRKYFQFDIRAKHESSIDYETTVVFVKIPTIKANFHFQRRIYEGSLDATGENLSLDDIVFNDFAYTDDIKYSLKGFGSEFFDINNNSNVVKLKVKDSSKGLELKSISNTSFLDLQLQASWDLYNDSVAVLIELPRREVFATDNSSVFEKPLYVGTLDDENHIHLEAIKVHDGNSTQKDDMELSLGGSESDLFDVSKEGNAIELSLKNPSNASNLTFDSNILLTLNGKVKDMEGKTNILLHGASPRQSANIQFFDKLWYKGKLEHVGGEQVLNFDPIPVRDGINVDRMAFSIKGEEASHFRIVGKPEDNSIHFELRKPIEADIVADRPHVIFDFHVRHLGLQLNNTLVVIVAFPKTACEVTSNGSSTSNGMPTISEEDKDALRFAAPEYEFFWSPNKIGSLGNITVISKDDLNMNVRYSLNSPNDHLQRRLIIDSVSGELKVLSIISPGVYEFKIEASNPLTSARASVQAKLQVQTMIQCEDRSVKVANALIVKHIEEEKAHEDLFNLTLGNCVFEILSYHPNDKEYVFVNRLNSTLSTIAIDREDSSFANMSVPQIQVTLQLHCDTRNRRRFFHNFLNRRKREVDDISLISLSSIPYSQDITILTLIIDDINDHSPVFVVPKANAFLAYPAPDISFELFPEYLIKVQAEDSDEGLNARIVYSIEDNEHFAIDPLSGVVYPKAKALSNEEKVELIIKAMDREGAENSLTSSIRINVKRLSSDFFTLMTFKGQDVKGIEDLVSELVQQTEFNVTIIKQAIIPKTSEEETQRSSLRLKRAVNNEIIQQAWLYALAGEQPITCVEFIKKTMTSSGNRTDVLLESYSQVGLTSNKNMAGKDLTDHSTGYIISLCVLSFITAALLGFIFWRFYPRYWICNTMPTVSSSFPNRSDINCTTFQSNGDGPYRNKSAKCFEPCSHKTDMDDMNLNDVWSSGNNGIPKN